MPRPVSDSAGLGWGPQCLFLTGDADAAGPQTTLEAFGLETGLVLRLLALVQVWP